MALTRPRLGQINTTVSNFTDPIVVFNAGSTAANVDQGILFNRANGLVANAALFFSESANSFVLAFTSNSGATNSNIVTTANADLKVKSLYLENLLWANGNPFTAESLYSNINVAAYLNSQNITSANIGTIFNSLNTLDANVGAFQIYANANIGSISSDISSLYANAAIQANILNVLSGNAVAQQSELANLVSNAATQAVAIDSINANIGSYQTFANANVSSIQNQIFASNANIGAYQTFANANLAGLTSNVSTLQANAGIQQVQINNIVSNANANTAAYLPTYSGNIGGTVTTISQPYISTLSNLTSFGGVFGDTTAQGNLTVVGNLTVQGNTITIGSNNLTVTDSIIDLHTPANLQPLVSDDGRDIGIRFHYYKGSDDHAFFGWENDTQTLIYLQRSDEINSNITGTYGNVQFGSMLLSNTTAATSTTSGALQVRGGAGINGALYIANTGDVSANIGNLFLGSAGTSANLSAYQTFANANAAAQAVSIDSINANLGAYQTFANANVVAIQANIGAFYNYANTKIGTNTNSNLVVVSTAAATSNTTGAIVVAGGVGIGGNVYANTFYTTTGIRWAGNGAVFASGGGGGTGTTYTANTAPPTSGNVSGDMWYNTSTDILYEYLNDGTNSYWVDVQSLGQTGNIVSINDSTLQGNITVGVNNRYSIGASTGYVQNVFVNNLTANNVTMNGNIVPSANITYNLGSTSLRWKDLFLSGNTIDLGGATIKTDTSGAIALIPQPTVSNPNPTGIVISPTGSITTVTTTGGAVSGNILANATTSASVSVGKSIAMAMVFGG